MSLATLDVDGRLVGPWVAEMQGAIAELRKDQAVCLNLNHLTFADAAGLSLLRNLQREGILLVGASPLIEGLLKLHADKDGGASPRQQPDDPCNRIAESAYLRAAARGFAGGDQLQDWLDAEAELMRSASGDPASRE